MGYSSETLHKLLTAVEILATSNESIERRALKASHSLIGISADEFPDGPGIFWNYISTNAQLIRDEAASDQVVSKYVSSIWQLFDACRRKG